MKLLSVDDSMFVCFSHMVHWSFILGQGWVLSNHVCKACQNCLCPSFEFVQFECGCMNCSFVVTIPANAVMLCKWRQLGQKQFWHVFTKLIAVQPSMAEYEWTMYQMKVDWLCYHALKSVLLCLFSILQNFGVKPGFAFFLFTLCIDSRLAKNFECNDCE